ncbi:MAG: pseudaminic acid cytidylyltransferase [Alphaproteobacteria bacterium]|jgi:N-acylneuraminate cytidylyltransferase|nr:pseudaminic acid cytidylyltransferase [Alphaproteobacteria bacterium]MCS5597592.1 pseudaminic acid cytidylyltransferase [Alphaproteobacteria bacterium]|tara:strand:+ start:1406 stop:2107 length:702 start_codon:yes stop_codon:yes gene_type:complete
MKSIAIIPARGGSKRIPRKNIYNICGKPMLAWPIEQAIKSKLFSAVIVSTDDTEIAQVAEQYGARAIMRPAELATDTAEEIDAYEHVLQTLHNERKIYPKYFCGVYPTAILIKDEDLIAGFEKFSDNNADVVMSVSEYAIHPYKALVRNIETGFLEMVYPVECNTLRSQEYPLYTASNGTFYWFNVTSFLKEKNYYPERLDQYILPRTRAVDVDVLEDLDIAQIFKKNQLETS